MLTFLFWNLGRNKRIDTLVRLVRGHDVDVLMRRHAGRETGI